MSAEPNEPDAEIVSIINEAAERAAKKHRTDHYMPIHEALAKPVPIDMGLVDIQKCPVGSQEEVIYDLVPDAVHGKGVYGSRHPKGKGKGSKKRATPSPGGGGNAGKT